ncbi:MAG TPA: NB-ARC domain-containing protein, partial [Ktedonobacteraceae bacterium]|nr:NB-ARC domain-containing protein [Ktedonobacteraceae bacterium]
ELKQRLAEIFETTIEKLGLLPASQKSDSKHSEEQAFPSECQIDWGEAPHSPQVFGREQELAQMTHWINHEQCQTIAILGQGGVGKTTLAIELATHVNTHFEFLFWRSLKNAPPLKTILKECLEFLTRQQPDRVPSLLTASEEEMLTLLLTLIREKRCLLILDNFESVMQQRKLAGQYRPGFEGYSELLRRIGESNQPGCLILTSREKPAELARMADNKSIHTMNLFGINEVAGKRLLETENLRGLDTERSYLVQRFSGNPLALKLISESIREVFGSEINALLEEGEIVFGEVQDLLEQQFERLSQLEQELIYGLTIEREAVTPHELQHNLAHFVARGRVIEALESLHRRSLIEPGSVAGNFTIQPVIMEYITSRLVEKACAEIMGEEYEGMAESSTDDLPWHLTSLPLIKAETKDYIKNTQQLLIVEPIVARLRATYGEQELLNKLHAWLDILRTRYPLHPGYLAGNILNLLITLNIDLRGFNFSHLTVRQVDLRGIALPDVNFTNADLSSSIFNDTFSTIFCVTLSPDGALLAAGTTSGEIRLWHTSNAVPLLTCRGHSDGIRSIAFSPDGRLLVSGSADHMLRLWDTRDGHCIEVLERHTGAVRSVAFSPDREIIASGSEDGTIRLWKTEDKTFQQILKGHNNWIRSLSFSPDGSLLASGSEDQTVRIWDTLTGQTIKVLHGHNAIVRSVTFNPEGTLLASAGDDMRIRLWDTLTGQNVKTLLGHRTLVRAVCFNQSGSLIASGSEDSLARIYDAQTGKLLFTLPGHTNRVSSLIFTPDNQTLITAGEDQTIRFWETQTGRCINTLHGRTSLIKSMAFSSDGSLLAEGSDDRIVRIWDVAARTCTSHLQGHTHRIRSIAFSPDGSLLASGCEDNTIRIWKSSSGKCQHILRGHTHLIRSVAFNNAGTLLASASYDHTIRLWDVNDGRCIATLQGHTTIVWKVAFSPDDRVLISSGKDQKVFLWDSKNGECLETMPGPSRHVRGYFLDQ